MENSALTSWRRRHGGVIQGASTWNTNGKIGMRDIWKCVACHFVESTEQLEASRRKMDVAACAIWRILFSNSMLFCCVWDAWGWLKCPRKIWHPKKPVISVFWCVSFVISSVMSILLFINSATNLNLIFTSRKKKNRSNAYVWNKERKNGEKEFRVPFSFACACAEGFPSFANRIPRITKEVEISFSHIVSRIYAAMHIIQYIFLVTEFIRVDCFPFFFLLMSHLHWFGKWIFCKQTISYEYEICAFTCLPDT